MPNCPLISTWIVASRAMSVTSTTRMFAPVLAPLPLTRQRRATAVESGTMLGAATHGFAAPPQFSAVFGDVAAQFFVSNMSSQDAVQMLVDGIDNAR